MRLSQFQTPLTMIFQTVFSLKFIELSIFQIYIYKCIIPDNQLNEITTVKTPVLQNGSA